MFTCPNSCMSGMTGIDIYLAKLGNNSNDQSSFEFFETVFEFEKSIEKYRVSTFELCRVCSSFTTLRVKIRCRDVSFFSFQQQIV